MSTDPSDEPEIGTAAADPAPGTTDVPVPPATRPGRHRRVAPRSRRRTTVIALLGVLVVVLGVVIGVTTFQTRQLDANVSRVENAFPSDAEARPAESVADSQTFLVAGVEPVAGSDRPLLSTVLLMHVTSDRAQAQVVAVPVNAWVTGADTTPADGFQDGGAAGLVGTVEELSDVRVDHYVQLDFEGFQQIIDDLQGVDVTVPQAYANRGYDFPVGTQHLSGAAALAYVRDTGPAARSTTALRQQAVVTAVFDRLSQRGALSDLGTLTGVLSTLTRSISVDETISDTDLVALAWDMRGVGRPDFVTTPMSGAGEQAGQSVLYVDDDRAAALWGFLRADTLADHLDDFR